MPALQPKTGNATPKGGKRKKSRDDDDSDDTENSDPEWSSSQSPAKGKQSRKSNDDQPSSMAESEETSVVPSPATDGKTNDSRSGELIFCGVLDFKAAKGQVVEDIAWEFSRLSALKGNSEFAIGYDSYRTS